MKKILFVILILFQSYATEVVLDEILYKVNGEIITKYDIDHALEMNKRLRKAGFPLSMEEKKVVDDMVKSILLKEELNKKNIYISDIDVTNHILNIGRVNNIKTIDDFKKIINHLGVDWDYFLTLQRSYIYQQYIMRYLPQVNQPTEEEIKKYYDLHKKDFFVKKLILSSEIFLEKPDEATFTDLLKLKNQMKTIQDEIKKGTDFEKLKSKYSDGDSKIDWKIELDYAWAPKIWTKIKDLKKGQISGVVDTVKGLLIIKILNVRINQEMPYKKIETIISQKIILERNKKALIKKVKDLKDQALIKKF